MSRELLNPFTVIPGCFEISIAAGKCNMGTFDFCDFRLSADGRIDIYNDPMDHPAYSFNPDDVEVFEMLAAHLRHYKTEWDRKKQEDEEKASAQAVHTEARVTPEPEPETRSENQTADFPCVHAQRQRPDTRKVANQSQLTMLDGVQVVRRGGEGAA